MVWEYFSKKEGGWDLGGGEYRMPSVKPQRNSIFALAIFCCFYLNFVFDVTFSNVFGSDS